MEKERFAILVMKDEKKIMRKRLKKHNLTFLEALPVDRAMLYVVFGIVIPDDKVNRLSDVEMYMVEGEVDDYEKYCKDPDMDIAQYSMAKTYYNNEEES